MGIEKERREDYFLNKFSFDDVETMSSSKLRSLTESKYLSLKLSTLDEISGKIKLLNQSQVSIKDKVVVLEIDKQQYLSFEQFEKLLKIREQARKMGAELKVKDGQYWELEEVLSPVSQLEGVANQILQATVNENGVERPLDEMERFLWAYSYVANRKYQANDLDLDSPRSITSIINTGDCVCVGFATLLKCLCDKIGVECYYNSCQVFDKIGQEEYGHANNIVVLNGKAYHCDACFDCVSESRPVRLFSHCLIPTTDVKEYYKTDTYNHTAPFANIATDLPEFKETLKNIISMEEVNEPVFKEYLSKISTYKPLIPEFKHDVASLFLKRDYKKEIIFHYTNAVDLLSKRYTNEPIPVSYFEQKLKNIYIASGKSVKIAQERAENDINITIDYSGRCYNLGAKNSFKTEYERTINL